MSPFKTEISGKNAELIKNPIQLEDYVKGKPFVVKNKIIKGADFDHRHIQNFDIEGSQITQYWNRYGTFSNSIFKDSSIDTGSFTESTITNVTYENVTFTDVGFIDTTMVNVTFKNCTFNESKFSGLKGKAKFIHSTLNAPDFYENEAILEFDNSTISNASNPRVSGFDMQKLPAAIYLKDSKLLGSSTSGPIRVGGNLTAFKANGGSIVNVGLGDSIKEVDLRHTSLDISTGGNIENLLIEQSQIIRLGIGDTRINQITISDCQAPVNLLSLIDGKFHHLDITNCTIHKFEPWSASGAIVDIRNSTLIDSNFQDAKLGELTLNNVTVGNINLTNAQAGHVNTNKVSFTPNSQLKDSGSNIKLH